MSRQADAKLRNAGEKAPPPKRSSSGEAAWRGYVNVEVSANLKAQFDDWAMRDDPWLTLSELVATGCVVSVKRDKSGSGYVGSVTQRDAGSVNAGLCVTARAAEAGKALFRVLFCISIMGPDPSWEAFGSIADPDRW